MLIDLQWGAWIYQNPITKKSVVKNFKEALLDYFIRRFILISNYY